MLRLVLYYRSDVVSPRAASEFSHGLGRERPMDNNQRIAAAEAITHNLSVEPNVFHAPAIVLAVHHDG
jgi:hypothetical protein